MHVTRPMTQLARDALTALLALTCGVIAFTDIAFAAGTDEGEIQDRPGAVARRHCMGGADDGDLCNEDADCSGSCSDTNVFNITVGIHFNATAAQIEDIKDNIIAGNEVLFDATDGQAEIGEVFLFNNAFGTGGEDADFRVYPATEDTWWKATTGNWRTGGSMKVSINYLSGAVNGEAWAHEFVHLVFDARDEYQGANVGCTESFASGTADCPDSASGETECLMDGGGGANTELCWGHGDPGDLTDISGGNHDATDVTEQSRCRDNRSCWDQAVWSWPDVMLKPAAAPDAAANGLVTGDPDFLLVDDDARVVLVLDESGSMDDDPAPMKIERLQVAATDFVLSAESGTELGLVSFSTTAEPADGHASVPIAAVNGDRSDWTDAIDDLNPPGGATNIGDGLQKAWEMIDAVGPVTANTYIVLMTDGINNEPGTTAEAAVDLQEKIDMLQAEGVPVYVTCTGSDHGLDSQCSEIASGTGGFYVDSADEAALAEAFMDFYERGANRDAIASDRRTLATAADKTVHVESGADSVAFALMWTDPSAEADLVVIDPDGNRRQSISMPQGRYARFPAIPGNWTMVIDGHGDVDSPYVARAYLRHQTTHMNAAVRHPTVLPGQPIYVYAYPHTNAGSLTHPTGTISGTVLLPDGSTDVLQLHDQGRDPDGTGDDIAGDGVFTGVYKATNLAGGYTFLLRADIDKWFPSTDALTVNNTYESPQFMREVRISAAVHDPNRRPVPVPVLQGWWKAIVVLSAVLLFGIFYLRRRRQGQSPAGV